MKKKSTMLFILLSLTCYSIQASELDSLKTQSKNVVYANAGTLGLWFTASANYERQLFSTNKKFHANYYMRACYGAYAEWGAEGPYSSLSLQGVFGLKKSHLEVGLGLGGLFDKTGYEIAVNNANYPYTGYKPEPSRRDYTTITPSASLGYRYQKPAGGFVFRTGIGFPDGVYFSFGWAF